MQKLQNTASASKVFSTLQIYNKNMKGVYESQILTFYKIMKENSCLHHDDSCEVHFNS